MSEGWAPQAGYWAGRRVLLTGHTGFKGTWLTCWLRRLGAEVMGVALPGPASNPSLWDQVDPGIPEVRTDISGEEWQRAAAQFEPEVVLHLAAQALVSDGYAHPLRTFQSNVLGTARIMEFISDLPTLQAAVIVTTDKVYEQSQARPHGEGDFLGGRDPYSASKAAAELVVASWPSATARVATARAGNVIGGGDWAVGRLLPDIVRHWSQHQAVPLRQPSAVRPWQHVLQPLHGYLLLAERLSSPAECADAFNFGPEADQCVDVATLSAYAAELWTALGRDVPDPAWQAAGANYAETHWLEIESSLAARTLGWRNVLDWREAVRWTVEWYAGAADARPTRELIDEQIAAYDAKVVAA